MGNRPQARRDADTDVGSLGQVLPSTRGHCGAMEGNPEGDSNTGPLWPLPGKFPSYKLTFSSLPVAVPRKTAV